MPEVRLLFSAVIGDGQGVLAISIVSLPPFCLLISSLLRGLSGSLATYKKLIYGEGFLYTPSRGKDAVSDAIWGIKLRGVFLTGTYLQLR